MTGGQRAEVGPVLAVRDERRPPPEWNAFVRAAPGGSFCHLAGWGDVLDLLGHETAFATARDGSGALRGILPLASVRSRLFGRFLVSMPFLNYGGPLGDDDARLALARWARDRARETGADLLELRSRPANALPDDGGESGLTSSARKVTVLLPLASDPEIQWEKGLKAKLRSQVRRPMKENLETRFGPGEVEPFYEVFARNMRDLGTPILPLGFFRALTRAFPDEVVFGTVYLGDEPVASGCGFAFGGEMEMTWASSLREHNAIAPNMLLYWRMMEEAIRRGCGTFNFGRCTPGGGTHRFKLQWGGSDEPLPWAAWSPTGEAATPNPGQGKYAAAIAVWQRLPVPLTRLIGPPLARRIP